MAAEQHRPDVAGAALPPRAFDRLIDSYTEGLIEEPEFKPRIAELRRRLARLEAEASEQQASAEQACSLQRVIGQLGLFAAVVRDRLATTDWSTKREIICLLVKRSPRNSRSHGRQINELRRHKAGFARCPSASGRQGCRPGRVPG